MPMVSIVLPTFNGDRYLSAAIESCIMQTFHDWEMLVVDDGSTDRSGEIAARWAASDPRISVVRHSRNRGLPVALNTGFAMAKAPYLTWTSDDNRYAPSAIMEMTRELNDDSAVDIVYTDYYVIDAEGNVIFLNSVSEYTRLVTGNCIGPCFLYRRAVQEHLRMYRVDAFLAEDLDFWLRASMHFRFKRLQQPLMYYRLHPGSLTSRRKEEILAVTERTIMELLPELPWATRQMKARGLLALALNMSRHGHYGRTATYLLRAYTLAPWFCSKHIVSVFVGRNAGAPSPGASWQPPRSGWRQP